ncbi:MAG TPA: hypothetical protein VKB50_11915 [Vicinamibacterales bacterium]|nr:hypothetical protein [Vicinamibacterales bacterium]
MTKSNHDASRDEQHGLRGPSDDELSARRAELEGVIEEATRDFIKTIEKSVASGAMTAEEASVEIERFKRELAQLTGPSGSASNG